MYERTRGPSSGYQSSCTNATAKMANDIGPRKTMFVLMVVVGCFAILWPKVFYPMLVGSANQHIKPSKIDKTTGCCDVFSEVDINTIKIMSELCSNIIEQTDQKPLSGKEIVSRCKTELQQTCGIDISAVLEEQFRLGRSVKQILSEVRSLNGSLCLKYHYGVAPWRLGVPHRIAVNFTSNVKQERPPHMRPDIVHPAFREKGSAIPKPPGTSKRAPKIVEGRPGPIPGMRPTLGGAGHVIPSQKTGSSMSVIMPIYTIGIVIFFSYTLMKLLFKKQPDGVGGSLYPPVEPDPRFRREVFESERCRFTPRLSRDPTGKIVVNAMSALLDEVNQEIEARRIANQEIYLQGALPAQSQILVTESAVVTEPAPSDVNTDPAVVLAGKMTLSVISLDSTHENEKAVDKPQPPSIEVAPILDILDINGDSENIEDEQIDESKYTTASSVTVAENEISEDEGTDNEAVDEDIEKINDLEFEMNHISGTNGTEAKNEGEDNVEEEIEEIEEEEIEIEVEEDDEEEEEEEIEEEEEEVEEIEEIEIEVEEEEEDEEIEEVKVENNKEVQGEEKTNENKSAEDKEIQEVKIENDKEAKAEENANENKSAEDKEIEEVKVENDKEVKVEEKANENKSAEDKEIEEVNVENDEEVKVEEKANENKSAEDKEIEEVRVGNDKEVKIEEKVNENKSEV